ncbi:MAG: TetR family transcriptional regulator [Sphingomonadales bacterium]|nr:TetR family transcriptional regulator [Sphingomonadales bacterium]
MASRTRDPGHEANRLAALSATLEQRRLTVRARIERCALEFFAREGLEAASVDAIAGAAGISRRTFYRYFESPPDILRAVINRAMDGWADAVRERPEDEPLLAAFRAADARALGSPESAEPLRLALAVMARSPDAWARVRGPMQAHATQAYRAIIARRLAASGRDPALAGAIAAGLTATMVHLAETAAREGRTLAPEEFEATLRACAALIAGDG